MRAVRGHSFVILRVLAIALSFTLVLPFTGDAAASTKGKLDWAKHRLHQLESTIGGTQRRLQNVKQAIAQQESQLHAVQSKLNIIAGKLAAMQGAYEHTRTLIGTTHTGLVAAQQKYDSLRVRIDTRARTLYESGPGSAIEFVFGATSLSDLTDRVTFVDAIQSQDADIANQTENVANALHQKQQQLELLKVQQVGQLRDFRAQQARLNRRFQGERSMYAELSRRRSQAATLLSQLAGHKARIGGLVGKFQTQFNAEVRARALAAQQLVNLAAVSTPAFNGPGPFRYCPVAGPHAYSDDFGAPRYTTSPPHPHAGNDIFAARGTPIVAPFDGFASSSPNGLGGNAVIVQGSQGYVYNAHLDRYGNLGSVSAGTVVGYVGNSGDAQGGATHDHFEWHPNVIPAHPWRSPYGYTEVDGAIDPYPYLNQVC